MADEFPIPYVASLSPTLKIVTECFGVQWQPYIEGVVEDIEYNRPVAASLRVPVPGERSTRQIDLRAGERTKPGEPKAQIVLKAFISWDHDRGCWHVMLEGPTEQYWEEALDVRSNDGDEVPGDDGPGAA